MEMIKQSVLVAIVIIVIVGVAASYAYSKEGMTGGVLGDIDSALNVNSDCPNVIMEVNGQIHLYNTRKAKVPGVNPIQLDSLNDYPQLMSYLNAKGMSCPALFLRQNRNAMGDIEMQQLVLDPQGNLVPIWGRQGLGAQNAFPNGLIM
jgi:hypothetical protein